MKTAKVKESQSTVTILAIESSCDDTSAAVLENRRVLSNFIANQSIHESYGGVVPELASRAHQQNIVPVVHEALKLAKKTLQDIDAIAYTLGPGLIGSLMVGSSFAKGLALALGKPLIETDHMQAHVLAHFIEDERQLTPGFPFLCLTVSGGHTQIVRVDSPMEMRIIGTTIDDAAGEAFDKAAKIMGLPYPGGPLIDKYAKDGNPDAFAFAHPHVEDLNYSFSGLKTSILYFVRDKMKEDDAFIQNNMPDLCASIQATIVEILFKKLEMAVTQTGIREVAISGGVSANSAIRAKLHSYREKSWKTYFPAFEFCTDNAAMIGITGYFKYLAKDFGSYGSKPRARLFALDV